MIDKVTTHGKALAGRKGAHPTAIRNASQPIKIYIETKKIADSEKTPFPWTTVLFTVVLTAMFLFTVMNYVKLDGLKDEVAARSDRIDELTKERDRLEEAVNKVNYLEIRDYAVNQLGMVDETDEAETYYIDVNGKDEVLIYEYEDEPENGIAVLLTGVGNVLKSFFGD